VCRLGVRALELLGLLDGGYARPRRRVGLLTILGLSELIVDLLAAGAHVLDQLLEPAAVLPGVAELLPQLIVNDDLLLGGREVEVLVELASISIFMLAS